MSIWEAELSSAFAVLLSRPLSEFDADASYVLYHWDDMMSAEFFETLPDLDLLHRVVEPDITGLDDADDAPFRWDQWALDLPRSVILLDDPSDFGADVDAGLRRLSIGDGQLAIHGADLATVLAAHAFNAEDAEGMYVTTLARVHTDGSLFDAMRAATWTMGGPNSLVPFREKAQAAPMWEDALRQVPHQGLRDHLRMLCLTAHWARSDGAYYVGAKCPRDLKWLTRQPGHSVVAAWEFGEAQAASAVFQIRRVGAELSDKLS